LDNTLDIGGTLWLQLQSTFVEQSNIEDAQLTSPNLVDVFLDARPNDRLRAFVQGRLNYDPTRPEAANTVASGLDAGFATSGTQVQLDQLWLRFDIARRAFITAGKQRIRWGSGRLWNPTDFLNQQRLNPISFFDIRLGVPLLKVHVPVESLGWNFYAVANLEQADQLRRVGGALRAEFLLGNTELSLSAALRDGDAQRLGADFTAPVGDFDVRIEFAVRHNDPVPRLSAFRNDELDNLGAPGFTPEQVIGLVVPAPEDRQDDWIPQIVVGTEIAVQYSDEDSIIFGLEYFFNDAGTDDENAYPRLLLAGRFNPLDVGRHYIGVFASLLGPGEWNETSFFASGIANLSDLSGVGRLDVSFQLLTHLSWRLFTNVFWGTGAFSPDLRFDPRLLGLAADSQALPVLLDRIPIPPETQALLQSVSPDAADGLQGGAPLVQVGMALVIGL
ncbi:MAG: hypothetical protein AAF449_13000, partial [Myxococcota bacterium]